VFPLSDCLRGASGPRRPRHQAAPNFTTACTALGASPARAVVVEDAVSGVRAGAAGGFGLVIGVAREDNGRELQENGADVVVRDLAETNLDEIAAHMRAKQETAR